jgi:hypothetical protein
MIKYLGSVGTFIRLNDNENKTYDLLNVYSSSAAKLLLFSAEVNNSTGMVSFDSASTSLYINGVSGSVIPNQQWAHITFSFDDKLATYDTNNFLIRFGDTASSNFNIQNTYIIGSPFTEETVKYLHEEFTGSGDKIIRIHDSASFSLNIIDTTEDQYTSDQNGDLYQPFPSQKRFTYDVVAATTDSLFSFTSASAMSPDDRYVDGTLIDVSDRIISLTDSQVYELTASSTLLPLSSSVGDFVKVLSGQRYGGLFYLNTASGFLISQGVAKIRSIVDTS